MNSTRITAIFILMLVVCGTATNNAQAEEQPVASGETQQDSSGNAPDRPFPSDRPGKANGPITVERGHFEIESDFVNYTHDHWAATPTTTQNFTVADPLMKLGITDNADIEFQSGGYQRYNFTDRSTNTPMHAYGFGDDLVRLKISLAGNDGSDFGIGIIPWVKLPVASSALRNAGVANNRIEGGLMVPVSYNLPDDFVLGYQAEIDANKNADDGNFHPTFVNIPSISHPVPGVDDLTGMLEFFSSVNPRRSIDDPNIYTLDVALAYQFSPKLAFDVETDLGLNREAPDVEAIFGIAWLY